MVADPLSCADIFLCMVVCSVSYIVVACRGRMQKAPFSVQRRTCNRTEMYIVNSLVTYTPILLAYCYEPFLNNPYFMTFAGVCELSGGLLNTLTYALQSRYATQLMGQPSSIGQSSQSSSHGLSFNVEVCSPGTSISQQRLCSTRL
uniref:Uncharacterized protein n=1 Tax=Noctiluca scintillans TaxID=2966 RepID=A0A7S1FEV2_NOCSC